MRTIKFRGRFWNKENLDSAEVSYTDGDMVYGGYVRIKFIFSEGYGDYIIIDLAALLVYPDSVAQLIAVDNNGREVYEGDLVKRIADSDDPDFDASKSFPMKATFEDYGGILDGEKILVEATS